MRNHVTRLTASRSALHRTTRDGGAMRARTRLVVLAVLGAVSAAGCNKPLFPENSARTQFETYDRLRQQSTPLEEEDEFGQKRPALRARLAPTN